MYGVDPIELPGFVGPTMRPRDRAGHGLSARPPGHLPPIGCSAELLRLGDPMSLVHSPWHPGFGCTRRPEGRCGEGDGTRLLVPSQHSSGLVCHTSRVPSIEIETFKSRVL